MSDNNQLQELYDKRDKLKSKIEIERAERSHLGNMGRVQDVMISQERENRLKDELNEINEEIAKFESSQNGGMVSIGGSKHQDFINGINDQAIVNDVLQGFGLNPNGNQNVEVIKSTMVRVTEDLEDGYQNIQQYSNDTIEQIQFNNGQKVQNDKNAQIKFILQELKDGVEISNAVKEINVSLNDVEQWYIDGKNGRGVENIGFYNEVKQIESSTNSNEIIIPAKKVDDTKKPKTPRKQVIENSSRDKNNIDEKNKMDEVLNYLSKKITYDDAAKKAQISPNLIPKWRKDGMNKVSENTIYFYNELNRIESQKYKVRTVKYVHSNNKHNVNSKKSNNFHENNKNDMSNIISFMKQGYDRKKACEEANVRYDLFNQWYNKGSKNYDEETRYFWRQVKNIEFKFANKTNNNLKPKQPKINYNSSKQYKSSNNISKNKNIIKSDFKTNNNHSHQNVYSLKEVIYPEMKKVLALMKKGNNRIQASRKTNVSIAQISKWYKEGSQNKDGATKYFYQELKKIEQKNESKHVDYNSIMKKDMNKVISFMEKGYDRKEASSMANIDFDKVNSWYNQGRSGYNKETREFYNKVLMLENKPKIVTGTPSEKNINKINISRVPEKPKISNKNNNSKIPEKPNKIVYEVIPTWIPDDMAKVLSSMFKGNNRIQASRKTNVSIAHISTWYKQGSKNYDKETKYFYDHVKKLESK